MVAVSILSPQTLVAHLWHPSAKMIASDTTTTTKMVLIASLQDVLVHHPLSLHWRSDPGAAHLLELDGDGGRTTRAWRSRPKSRTSCRHFIGALILG